MGGVLDIAVVGAQKAIAGRKECPVVAIAGVCDCVWFPSLEGRGAPFKLPSPHLPVCILLYLCRRLWRGQFIAEECYSVYRSAIHNVLLDQRDRGESTAIHR